MKDTKHPIKNLLDDAAGIANKFIDGIKDERNDILFGDIIEGCEYSDGHNYKKTTIFKSMVLEFVLTLLFGYIGIPALFRRNKVYGVAKFALALAAVWALFYLRSWYLMVPLTFLYALDLGMAVSRLVIFIRGKRFAKKFSSYENEESTVGSST